MVQSLWDNSKAAELKADWMQLVYRSNIIGTDRRVCNWGGGNTSSKTTVKDFRGRDVEVMYVKGSGSDLATMKAGNFTGLRMDDIRPLFENARNVRRRYGRLSGELHDRRQTSARFHRDAAACVPAVQACRPYASGCHYQPVLRG